MGFPPGRAKLVTAERPTGSKLFAPRRVHAHARRATRGLVRVPVGAEAPWLVLSARAAKPRPLALVGPSRLVQSPAAQAPRSLHRSFGDSAPPASTTPMPDQSASQLGRNHTSVARNISGIACSGFGRSPRFASAFGHELGRPPHTSNSARTVPSSRSLSIRNPSFWQMARISRFSARIVHTTRFSFSSRATAISRRYSSVPSPCPW
jgi:hypothetical protein